MAMKRTVLILIGVAIISPILIGGYFWDQFSSIQETEKSIAIRELRTDIMGVGILNPTTMERAAILSDGSITMDTVYFQSINQRTKEKHITKISGGRVIWVDIGFGEWFTSEKVYPDLSPTPLSLRPLLLVLAPVVLAICAIAVVVLWGRMRAKIRPNQAIEPKTEERADNVW